MSKLEDLQWLLEQVRSDRACYPSDEYQDALQEALEALREWREARMGYGQFLGKFHPEEERRAAWMRLKAAEARLMRLGV
jgi:hypothetical protein